MDDLSSPETSTSVFTFSAAMREDMANSVLCWLATVGADGMPNVSPKEVFCPHGDDVVLIANIASPQSRRNIAQNPKACLSFVDIFRQRGFKLTGEARIIAGGTPEFEVLAGPLLTMAGPDFKVLDIFRLKSTEASLILAPSYRIFPERTPEEHIRRMHQTYGVRPA